MFATLHPADLYNMFGGTYMISIDESNMYTQKGNISVKVIDNSTVEDVEYTVFLNDKSVNPGLVTLEEGETYNFTYSETNWSSIIITLVVMAAIIFVISAFVIIKKKKN